MTIRVGGIRLYEIGRQIFCFDGRARDASTFFIENISLDGSRRDLRLSPPRRGKSQRERQDKERTQQMLRGSLCREGPKAQGWCLWKPSRLRTKFWMQFISLRKCTLGCWRMAERDVS